ncbi:MAG TPA: PAS domain-containing protein [Gemmatimonadales bacterium]|nr:PAS domain-containing protein [Gemmatimonadales bacterium]
MKQHTISLPWRSAAQVLLGSAAVLLVTVASFRLGLNVAMAVLGDLVVIVLLSLSGSFAVAALVSVTAVLGLGYVFVTPKLSAAVTDPLDVAALIVFLTTALVISRLVSRVRQTLSQLRAANQELGEQARLLDLTHDSLFVRNLDGVILYWNRGAEELYGWRRQEVLGKVTHELLQTVFPVPFQSITEELFRTGRWEGELQHTRRDGTKLVVASRWSLQRDEQGLPTGILETNNDITERKRAEEALRRSESYLAEAQRLSNTGSFGWDVADPHLIWSEETFRIFEYDPAQIEATVDRVFERIHPEDRPGVRQLLDRAAEEGEEWNLDHRLLMPDGRIKHVHVMARPVRGPSGRLEFIGAVMDVTAARKAEEELRRSEAYLAEAQRLSHTGSWARNLRQPDDSYWSAEGYRIFRVNPAGDPALVLQEMRERVHPDDWPRLTEAANQAIRNNTDFEVNYRAVLPDGSVRYIHTVGHPITNAAGEVVELVGTVIDVTDRKRAERALRRARERTLEARFAAMLAERTRLAREIHDTLLQGFTGVALKLVAATNRMTHPPETVAELREVITLAQQTLSDARHAVWDLRAPSLSRGDFPAALRLTADDCVRGTGLKLEYGCSGLIRPLDPEIEAVAIRVLQESITNVVKHAAANTVRVRLGFQARRVRLSIADDGRGFTVDPEFQTYGGHWGLLGMRERTSQVRGTLSVHSAPGAGTEIVLQVPYEVPRAGIASQPPFPVEPSPQLDPKALEPLNARQ